MVDFIAVLHADLEAAEPQLRAIDDADAGRPWAPGKWSRREVIGHLVDSASVNHERFVRALDGDALVFPGYDQDAWVTAQRYRDANWKDLVDLWIGINRHLARLMGVIPEADRRRLRRHHNLDRIAFRPVPVTRPATLDDLMGDYVVHLEHHLTQVLGAGWAFRSVEAGEPTGRHVLDTERLTLREMTDGDLPFVAEMLGDAETMRFYPKVYTPIEARGWLDRQQQRYATDGHGLWLVTERGTGERVGQVGLARQHVEGRSEPEIGWLVQRSRWRRGVATEAASAVRDLAFGPMGLDRVISLIRPVNEPSQGVARKIGMRPEREVTFHDYRHIVFAVRRARSTNAEEQPT